jgi:hypothetical protein
VRGLPSALHPFQREDIARMLSSYPTVINSNPLGAGKTVEALGTIQGWLDMKIIDHAVVFARKSCLDRPWRTDAARFFPSLNVTVFDEATRAARSKVYEKNMPEVLVLVWELINNPLDRERLLDLFMHYKCALIGDEGHLYLSGGVQAKQPATYSAWLNLQDKAHRTIVMTGTMLSKSPADLYSLLCASGLKLGSYKQYELTYCLTHVVDVALPGGRIIKKKIPIDFKPDMRGVVERMLKQWVLRRPADLITLPKDRAVTRLIRLNEEERALYNALDVQDLLEADLEVLFENQQDPLRDHAEMRAILSGKRAQRLTPSKDLELIALMPELIADGNKAAIFSPYKETVFRLQRTLSQHFPQWRFVTYTGDDSAKARRDAVEALADPNTVALLMTEAAGTGTDGLQDHISRLVRFDRLYVPSKEEQIYGRIYRQGQQRECLTINFEVDDTLEQKVVKQLARRRRLMNKVSEMSTCR